ncbi:YbaK/EbsC family protein [uncultured Victivallis sp.]|uniref:YbaK/EbsC family protein n=1 Tax=uncultured Victivallis sp. TaxID=354118 RepID=UPI002584B39A|nr:YbaK/EbsC family protein [uncultured Victivallis sp.]
MSVTTVKEYLKQWNKDAAVREFEVSSATVELAAQALGVEPARIAKTLSFSDDGDGCILIVAAGDAKIDNAKFKAFFHRKARMLSPDEVIARTGHAIGGVCPFAITNPAVRIWLDESLKRFTTVFPACGSSNSAIELTCAELEICSRALGWIDVCKGWTEPPIIC